MKQKMETLNQNVAELNNKVKELTATGFNYANFNTLDGGAFTGDSVSTLNLLNKLNSNITGTGNFSVFNIYSNYIGDVVFKMAQGNAINAFTTASSEISKNSITGALSSNNALSDNSFTVKEANGNDAKIVNDIDLEAVTGNNSADYNTGNGSVSTGNATALGNIINLANTNINVSEWLFGVVNIWGSLLGNIILPQNTGSGSNGNSGNINSGNTSVGNGTTGAGSTNNTSTVKSENDQYTNTNTAQVANNLDVTANSGNNTSSYNTQGGAVTSGTADTSVNTTTVANTNTVDDGGTVWLVIVNEMGKWVGHILGTPWGTTAASNSLPVGSSGADYGITTGSGTPAAPGNTAAGTDVTVQNSTTGYGSQNNASFNTSSDNVTANTNNASVENNIAVKSDTGNNETKYNTGAGIIETGDAKSGLNLFNMLNMNVTAKKFVVLFVNVLGNFVGDVVPPDTKGTAGNPDGGIPSPTPTLPVNGGNGNTQQGDTGNTSGNNGQGGTGGGSSIPGGNTDSPGGSNAQGGTGTSSENSQGDSGGSSQTENNGNGSNQNGTNDGAAGQYPEIIHNDIIVYGGTSVPTGKTRTVINGRYLQNGTYYQRGIFLSQAFMKATETTKAGTLFGGVKLHVSRDWLLIIPFATIILFLRRRRKFITAVNKYVSLLMEIIL